MNGYYDENLAAERLRAVYDLAPARTKAYLEAEIEFVLERVSPRMRVLELGCGYGRVLARLVERARETVGIDTSISSLRMAREYVGGARRPLLAAMDAAATGFADRAFDLTICIQNGISAFHVDRAGLFKEAMRVTRSGGKVLFSSYAADFWKDRLEWFEIQSARGFIGPIDREATRDGVIVCTDGFRATTVTAEEFRALAAALGLEPLISEVDRSSLFCEVVVV
jgi:2-polyprenyl-6-hydroxyphenyl methylase/3-demethylubiquinone-9 3-methyltransferase